MTKYNYRDGYIFDISADCALMYFLKAGLAK